MSSSTGVVVMECHYLWPGMDVIMYLPAVITCIIAFPFDQILKVVILYATVKDLLNLIFILTINNNWGWRRGML
jgi:hypothetical protein